MLYRKKEPSESFMKSIFEAKVSKVSSIQHGKHNEVIVRSLYARKMQKQLHKKFTVYDCVLVVIPSHPYLGASPDGIVWWRFSKQNKTKATSENSKIFN